MQSHQQRVPKLLLCTFVKIGFKKQTLQICSDLLNHSWRVQICKTQQSCTDRAQLVLVLHCLTPTRSMAFMLWLNW
jgi:hypothetical protein